VSTTNRVARAIPGIAVVLAVLGLSPEKASAPADLLFRHGAVFTVNAARSWASAVAVRDGRITYVGTDAGSEAYRGPKTRVVDLEGRMLLPGFHDAHVHPVSGGMESAQCDLSAFATKEEVLEGIRRYAAAHPTDTWILGSGWALPIFPGANPTRQELDALVADRPAYLEAADGHSAWVNSRALEIAGVTRDTKDPRNGRIEHDGSGEPSGTLREAAKALVSDRLPKPTPADYRQGLARGLAMANRFGITSFIEANADQEKLEAYADLEREGKLTARVVVSQSVDVQRGPEQVAELAARRARYSHGRLRVTAAKIFADGVVESETAALLSPYLDRPGWSGEPNLTPEAFDRLAVALDKAGFQIHIHAIGDRAVRMALDALEAAREANGPRDARPLVAHLEVIDPHDIPRFRQLDVLPDFQPLWAFADSYIRDLTLPQLGPERSRWIYPIESVVATGAVVVAGSDWNVSSMNPLDAIQVAVTRRDPADPSSTTFIPEERVDLPTILAAYTINGAYASHEEGETGSIEAGKAADLIVLDHDLFEIPPEKIHEAKVLWTLLGGREVYREASYRP
jgi:predicted amidohydrolase YtcJ